MNYSKQAIIEQHCYTELVYARIQKKLAIDSSNEDIRTFILDCLEQSNEDGYIVKGKNIYIHNYEKNIRITINSNSVRVITVDRLPMRNTQ